MSFLIFLVSFQPIGRDLQPRISFVLSATPANSGFSVMQKHLCMLPMGLSKLALLFMACGAHAYDPQWRQPRLFLSFWYAPVDVNLRLRPVP